MVTFEALRSRRPDGEPTVTLEDVFAMNEILLVKYENSRRAQRAADNK